MTTPHNEDSTAPTAWLVELCEAGTSAAQWVLGSEEEGIGFYAEGARSAPGTTAGTAPGEEVAAWVAEFLWVPEVKLTQVDDNRWSVTITK